MIQFIRIAIVWCCLASASGAVADTRIIVLFDTSASMDGIASTHLCSASDVSCWLPRAHVQVHEFGKALASSSPVGCTKFYIKMAHWNVMVRHTSTWQDITTTDGRQRAQQQLLATPLQVEFMTNQFLAFWYAQGIVASNPEDEFAIILVSDGKPSDGWTSEHGAEVAERDGFLFFDIVYEEQMSPQQLQTVFKHSLDTIQNRLHGCTG